MQENKPLKSKEQQKRQSLNQLPQVAKAYYKSLKNVRLTFGILQDFVKKLNNFQLVLPPQTKLLQVKKIIDQISQKNFNFYLKQSFMPSLNSRIGDLAQCYGRFDQRQKIFQINFKLCAIKDYFG